jgi:hypothetical protein
MAYVFSPYEKMGFNLLSNVHKAERTFMSTQLCE